MIDLDTDELTEIVTSIGTPVSSFLMQDDIAAVIPSDGRVPYQGDNGATTLALYTAALLLLAGCCCTPFLHLNLKSRTVDAIALSFERL